MGPEYNSTQQYLFLKHFENLPYYFTIYQLLYIKIHSTSQHSSNCKLAVKIVQCEIFFVLSAFKAAFLVDGHHQVSHSGALFLVCHEDWRQCCFFLDIEKTS